MPHPVLIPIAPVRNAIRRVGIRVYAMSHQSPLMSPVIVLLSSAHIVVIFGFRRLGAPATAPIRFPSASKSACVTLSLPRIETVTSISDCRDDFVSMINFNSIRWTHARHVYPFSRRAIPACEFHCPHFTYA